MGSTEQGAGAPPVAVLSEPVNGRAGQADPALRIVSHRVDPTQSELSREVHAYALTDGSLADGADSKPAITHRVEISFPTANFADRPESFGAIIVGWMEPDDGARPRLEVRHNGALSSERLDEIALRVGGLLDLVEQARKENN